MVIAVAECLTKRQVQSAKEACGSCGYGKSIPETCSIWSGDVAEIQDIEQTVLKINLGHW